MNLKDVLQTLKGHRQQREDEVEQTGGLLMRELEALKDGELGQTYPITTELMDIGYSAAMGAVCANFTIEMDPQGSGDGLYFSVGLARHKRGYLFKRFQMESPQDNVLIKDAREIGPLMLEYVAWQSQQATEKLRGEHPDLSRYLDASTGEEHDPESAED